MDISLSINGQSHTVKDILDDTPLLWVLRDELGLVGAKYGCGGGFCGACTVHVNGQAVRSCMTPAKALSGEQITTIEGLAQGGEWHPLQQAWIDLDVPQCGYCQSGQIMSAAALLARNRHPTEQDINNALAGNLCRCGCYGRIRAAIKTAAEKLDVQYFDPQSEREITA